MQRLGYVRIREDILRSEKIHCRSCGGTAKYRVTFKDNIGTVVVTLCEKCINLEYEELKLQNRLNFPAKKRGESHE